MEVTFGEKSDFPIQAMLEPELKPPSSIWGRMCLWVSGIQIGDYNQEHCGLGQCNTHLNQVLEILDQLYNSEFGNRTDKEIYNFLENAWLNPNFDDFGAESKLTEFHKFRFDYGFAEMFDSEPMSFLFKRANGSLKLLFKVKDNPELQSHIFPCKLFVESVEKLDAWYRDQSIIMDSKNA